MIIRQLFDDTILVEKIQRKLPHLFQLAELECSRAAGIGLEVGSVREKILSALLVHKFGEDEVKTEIPITKSEIDIFLMNTPISIKTISGRKPKGIKLI